MRSAAGLETVDQVFDFVDGGVVFTDVAKGAGLVHFGLEAGEAKGAALIDFTCTHGLSNGSRQTGHPLGYGHLVRFHRHALSAFSVGKVEDLCIAEELYLVDDIAWLNLHVGLEGEFSCPIVGYAANDGGDGPCRTHGGWASKRHGTSLNGWFITI